MKTLHIVLGIAAVAGVAWYIRKRNTPTVTTDTVTQVETKTIPMPKSEAEATKIVKLPDSLLQNTSGNTGIIPPVLKTGSTPIKVATPLKTPILKQTNIQGLSGFALN